MFQTVHVLVASSASCVTRDVDYVRRPCATEPPGRVKCAETTWLYPCASKTTKVTALWNYLMMLFRLFSFIHSFTILFITSSFTYPLTARVVGAPQMTSQTASSFFHCFSLPFGAWGTPGLSIPWCCLLTSSSVCLDFYPNSLCLARWFWPDLMNGRHVHTTSVCVSIRSSGGLRVVWLPAGSWHGLPRWSHGLCKKCLVSCGSNSFPWLVFFLGALLWGSMIHKHTGRWMW